MNLPKSFKLKNQPAFCFFKRLETVAKSSAFVYPIDTLERRTVSGAQFLWLVLQHVLPKGFRRARNFGFLHPNCKRLIALLRVLLRFAPGRAAAWVKQRAPILCACCGAVMVIVRTRIRPAFAGPLPVPIVIRGAQ